MAVIDELIAKLGFKVEGEGDLRRAVRTMADAATGAASMAARFAAAFSGVVAGAQAVRGALTAAASAAANLRAEVGRVAREANISPTGLTAGTQALRFLGLEAGQAREAMLGLRRTQQEALAGNNDERRQAFRNAGIPLDEAIPGRRGQRRARDPLAIMAQIAGRVERIQDADPQVQNQRRMDFLKELGIEETRLQQALMRGQEAFRGALDQSRRAGLLFGPQEIAQATEYQERVNRIGLRIDGLTQAFSSGAIEGSNRFLTRIEDFLAKLQTDEFQQGLKRVSDALARFADSVAEGTVATLGATLDTIAIPFRALVEVVSRLTGAEEQTLTALGVGLAAVAVALARFPAVTILTALTAFIGEYLKWQRGEQTPLAGIFNGFADAAQEVDRWITWLKGRFDELLAIPDRFAQGLRRMLDSLRGGSGGENQAELEANERRGLLGNISGHEEQLRTSWMRHVPFWRNRMESELAEYRAQLDELESRATHRARMQAPTNELDRVTGRTAPRAPQVPAAAPRASQTPQVPAAVQAILPENVIAAIQRDRQATEINNTLNAPMTATVSVTVPDQQAIANEVRRQIEAAMNRAVGQIQRGMNGWTGPQPQTP